MPVSPLEFRYGRPETKAIFDEKTRLQRLLDVEAALARAHAKLGHIPQSDADIITRAADVRYVTLERAKEIESEIHHDIMAVVKALTEQCGSAGRYIHMGATSNDIIDTANALQIRDGLNIVLDGLKELHKTLCFLAERYRDTIMLGRTHGQYAVPITFGLKMAVFAEEIYRHIVRLESGIPRIAVGKMMGAVGTGASYGKDALRIQELVMKDLGIGYETASTQLVGRDRYAEMVSILVNIATSLEKFSTEVRNLQRPEINEVAEAFDSKKQVGSSTMAHKKNPITAENICGLARIIRSFTIPAYEDNVLWHERDLTNSSAERFVIPYTIILTDDIIQKAVRLFSNLNVHEDVMLQNLEATQGIIMAESVMLALTEAGMGRQEAHELVRQLSMEAEDKGVNLRDVLMASDDVRKYLSEEGIKKALDYRNYTGAAGQIVDRAVERCK